MRLMNEDRFAGLERRDSHLLSQGKGVMCEISDLPQHALSSKKIRGSENALLQIAIVSITLRRAEVFLLA
jgi:hypothetical protein